MYDVTFWANWLNVIPAVLYVMASLLGVIDNKLQNQVDVSASSLEDTRSTLLAVRIDGVLWYLWLRYSHTRCAVVPTRPPRQFGS
jgi:hypothetical protein